MELEFHQIAKRYAELRISMPGYEGRLMASLASEGQLQPVLVVESQGEGVGYVLIDGYRRARALEGLCRDTVEAMVLPLTEPAALMFRHCRQSARVPDVGFNQMSDLKQRGRDFGSPGRERLN